MVAEEKCTFKFKEPTRGREVFEALEKTTEESDYEIETGKSIETPGINKRNGGLGA